MIKRKLIRIKIDSDYYAFGLIIDKTFMSFFDFITKDKSIDLEKIIKKPILFNNAVNFKQALKANEWEILGEVKIENESHLLVKRPYYIQDSIDKDLFFISYPPNYDKMKKVSKKECLGLEKMLIYYPEHVLDRLKYHFFNTEPKWISSYPFWIIDKLGKAGNDAD